MTTKPPVAEAVPPTPVAPRRAAMALAIQTVTGQRLAVDDTIRTDTLARLRARISLTHGIAAGTQRLMIDQVTLEEGPQTLAERGIGQESALFLSLQAADQLITERQRAVAAAETAAAEADTAAQGQVGALMQPQPRSRLLLYRDDGSPKHWRWFHLSRDVEGVASVSWGKNEDGSNHMLWASCGSTPPKSCEVHGVSAEDGPAGIEHGFRILRRSSQPLLVAAADGETREKWVGALDAVQSQREAVGALERAREALRRAPTEAAGREEEAREAERFVEHEREVHALLVEAERQIQMGAEEFGAAVVTLRRALTLDGANKEAWAALDRVAFVLGGTIYAFGDDGRLDLAGQELGREGVAELARWLATDAGAALNSLAISRNFLFGTKVENKGYSNEKIVHDVDKDQSGWNDLCEQLKGSNITSFNASDIGMGPVALRTLATSLPAAVASLRCGNNPGMVGELEYGRLKTPDAHAEVFKELTDSLKTSQVTEADFSSCGIGPVALGHVSEWVREATAALNSLTLDSNSIFGIIPRYDGDSGAKPDKFADDCDAFLAALKESNILTLSLQKTGIGPLTLRKLATSLPAAVARLILDENPLTGSTHSTHFDKDITGVVKLCDTLKTSSVTELSLAKCRLGPGSVGKLAEYVREAEAALNSLNLGGASFGDMGDTLEATLLVDGAVVECRLAETQSKDNFEYQGRVATTIPKQAEASLTNAMDLDSIVALSHRGGCTFVEKSSRVAAAGAIALILVNSDDEHILPATEDSTIPVVAVRSRDGQLLEQATQISLMIRTKPCALKQLCGALKTSKVKEIDFSSCGLESSAMAILSDYVHDATAAVASLRCTNNPGMAGKLDWRGDLMTPDAHAQVFKELTDSLKTSQVTEANFSSCGIGPVSLGHLSDWVREATTAVARLILDKNPLTGGTHSTHFDMDITGVVNLCDTLKTSSVTELSLAKCRLGPGSLGKLAEYVREAEAALNLLTVTSTGGQTYTLTRGEGNIELSNKKLGPADIQLLSAWLATPAAAALTSINCLMNPIGEDGLATLVSAIKDSPVRSICGLTEGQMAADFSGMGLGPFDCKIMKAEFDFRGAIAALNSLTIDSTGVPFVNYAYKESRDATGPRTYTLTVGEEKIDLSQKNLGSADVALVAAWLQRPEVSATLNSVTLDSTGVMTDRCGRTGQGTQKAYTLTVGEEHIDLSMKNLGSADVALVATWLQRPEVIATLGSADVALAATWLQRPEVIATLTGLDVRQIKHYTKQH